MTESQCPKCNQRSPSSAALCLHCGALFPLDGPLQATPNVDPWRRTPLPGEVRFVIALIVLELFIILFNVFASPRGWTAGASFSFLLNVALLIDLFRRTALAWWVAVVLSGSRIVIGMYLLNMTGSEFDGFLLCGMGFTVIVLLVISRARGSYMLQFEGERRDVPAPPRTRKACRQCGGPCPDIDNTFTRAGVCSKKCLEREP